MNTAPLLPCYSGLQGHWIAFPHCSDFFWPGHALHKEVRLQAGREGQDLGHTPLLVSLCFAWEFPGQRQTDQFKLKEWGLVNPTGC